MAQPASRVALVTALFFATSTAFAQDAVNPWASASGTPPSPPAEQQGDTVNPWQTAPPDPPPAADSPPPPAARGKKGKALPPPKKPVRAPARPARRPPPPRGKRGKAPAISFDTPIAGSPTFVMLDGGATRIAVEVSRKVDISEHKAQGRVIYRIKGAAMPDRTSRLPLLLGYFSSHVERVEIVDQGSDADLVIDVRDGAEPKHRVVDTPRGIVLQVDFARPPVAPGEARPQGPQEPPPTIKRSASTRRLGTSDEQE